MQSFDTDNQDLERSATDRHTVTAGNARDFPPGSRKTVELPAGHELALFNINGEFHAIDNSCPHKGAPLVEGTVCGDVVECEWHGWQFDLRTGECLTVTEKIQTYEVVIEEGLLKILV